VVSEAVAGEILPPEGCEGAVQLPLSEVGRGDFPGGVLCRFRFWPFHAEVAF